MFVAADVFPCNKSQCRQNTLDGNEILFIHRDNLFRFVRVAADDWKSHKSTC